LLTILRGHYRVDSPTKLYHQLLNISQEPKETALNFVLELQAECQTAPTPVQSHPKPREFPTTVAEKTVKNKETKSDTQQIIEELHKEIKEMFLAAMETSPYTMVTKQRQKGCTKCRDKGKDENCMHCFRCGQEGHYSRGYRAPRLSTGNTEGLLRGDQQYSKANGPIINSQAHHHPPMKCQLAPNQL
ncbi:hypothetical protein GOODEAATRI_032445, partial [Goodea atripinnis]